MISLVTVPHTGTIFTGHALDRLGIQYVQHHVQSTSYQGWDTHAWDYWHFFPTRNKVLCTLRDPMMAVISAINRGEHKDEYNCLNGWRVLAKWHKEKVPNVHFFRVDCDTAQRPKETLRLAEFLQVDEGRLDWTPQNTSPDYGLKDRYSSIRRSQYVPSELKYAFRDLMYSPEIKQLFLDHGYGLPWMFYKGYPEDMSYDEIADSKEALS